MVPAVSAAFTAFSGFFGDMFALITASDVVPWVAFGIGVSVFGVAAKYVRKLIWGM